MTRRTVIKEFATLVALAGTVYVLAVLGHGFGL